MDLLPEPALPPAKRTYGGNAAFHNFYNDYSHITDPNLRRRLALSEVDKIPFGWYVHSPTRYPYRGRSRYTQLRKINIIKKVNLTCLVFPR